MCITCKREPQIKITKNPTYLDMATPKAEVDWRTDGNRLSALQNLTEPDKQIHHHCLSNRLLLFGKRPSQSLLRARWEPTVCFPEFDRV